MLALLAAAASVAIGCSSSEEDASNSGEDDIRASNPANIKKGTLVIEQGCMAVKIGDRQLLVSARCIASKKDIAADRGIIVSPLDQVEQRTFRRGLMIEHIEYPPSFAAKCQGDAGNACGVNTVAAGDAPDVAVLVIDGKDLRDVPTLAIDLDTVGVGDSLTVLGSSCMTLDQKHPNDLGMSTAIAVPAKSVAHGGSAYETKPELVTQLGASYTVTAGTAWHGTAQGICDKDFGVPMFRAGTATVAGITSNATLYVGGQTPVTVEHTRLDTASRYKIGTWLKTLGAKTTHSCGLLGCTKRTYDGGAPPAGDASVAADASASNASDAGSPKVDAGVTELPGQGDDVPLQDTGDDVPDMNDDPSSPGGSSTSSAKKSASDGQGGCQAGHGALPTGDVIFGVGLAVAALLSRRRRAFY